MIELVVKSINQVSNRFYSIENPEIRNNTLTSYSRRSSNPEQRFAAELYRHIANEMDTIEQNNHINVFADPELYKTVNLRNDENKYINTFNECINQDGIRPDLVIHEDQRINRPESQIMAMEIKTVKNLTQKSFNKDFFKMFLYIREYNFQSAFFIIVNNSYEHISSLVNNYIENYYFVNTGKIKVIIKEDSGKGVEIITFDEKKDR